MKSLITLFVMLVLTIGCSKDDATSPTQPQVASIELQASNTLIRGFNGEFRPVQITAIVRDENYVLVAGKPVHFAIQDPLPWKGSLDTSPFDTVTNEMGQMYVNYKVTIEQSGEVVIKATCGEVFALLTISIDVPTHLMALLSINTTDATLIVPPDETRQTTVTARLMDYSGQAVSGELLRFSASPPSMGVLDSDTATTGFNGSAIRTFSSIANQYGVCRVIVMYGDSTAWTEIRIRPL